MIDRDSTSATERAADEGVSISNEAASYKDRRKDRLIRIRSVIARTGLSASTIYRREAKGLFPKKRQMGVRCIAWYQSDIEDFIADPFNYRST